MARRASGWWTVMWSQADDQAQSQALQPLADATDQPSMRTATERTTATESFTARSGSGEPDFGRAQTTPSKGSARTSKGSARSTTSATETPKVAAETPKVPSTKLVEVANAGSTHTPVGDASGFAAGDVVAIESTAGTETNVLKDTSPMQLERPLKLTQPVGATLRKLTPDDPQYQAEREMASPGKKKVELDVKSMAFTPAMRKAVIDSQQTSPRSSASTPLSPAQERLNSQLAELMSKSDRTLLQQDSNADVEQLTKQVTERAVREANDLVEEVLRQALPMLRDGLRKEMKEESKLLRAKLSEMSPRSDTKKLNERQAAMSELQFSMQKDLERLSKSVGVLKDSPDSKTDTMAIAYETARSDMSSSMQDLTAQLDAMRKRISDLEERDRLRKANLVSNDDVLRMLSDLKTELKADPTTPRLQSSVQELKDCVGSYNHQIARLQFEKVTREEVARMKDEMTKQTSSVLSGAAQATNDVKELQRKLSMQEEAQAEMKIMLSDSNRPSARDAKAIADEGASGNSQLLKLSSQIQVLQRHVHAQQESQSSNVARKELEAMREQLNNQFLEVRALIREQQGQQKEAYSSNVTRKELEAIQERLNKELSEMKKELMKEQQEKQQAIQSSHASLNHVESMKRNIDDHFLEMKKRYAQSDSTIRSDLDSIRATMASELKGHGDTTKEHANKLEQLLRFRDQVEGLQSTHVPRKELEDLRKGFHGQLAEMKNLLAQKNAQSDLSIRGELEAIKEATSSDLRGHGEATKEQANKIEQLLDLKGQMHGLQQKLQAQQEVQSTRVALSDFDSMREGMDDKLLELRSLVQELRTGTRSEFDTIRNTILADLRGQAEAHNQHVKQNMSNLTADFSEFKSHSQELHHKLQSQHEAQSSEVSSNIDALQKLMTERGVQSNLAIREELEAMRESLRSDMLTHGETSKEHADKIDQLFDLRAQVQGLQSTHVARIDLEAMLESQVAEMKDLMQDYQTGTQSALEGISNSALSEMKGHGEATKELASQLEKLWEFRGESQELQQKLQTLQEVQSTHASRNLEALRESTAKELSDLKNLMSERTAESDVAIRQELAAIRESTSSDLQGHGKASQEHADKLQELLEFRGQMQELQQNLRAQQEAHSSEASRNLEALRESTTEQIANVKTLFAQLGTESDLAIRAELEAIKNSTSSGLQGHGDTAKEHADKLQELVQFKSQMQEMQQQLQAQQELQAKETTRQLAEAKTEMSELRTQTDIAIRSELEIITGSITDLHGHRESTKDHANKLEELLELRSHLQALKDSTASDLQGHGDRASEHADQIQQLLGSHGQLLDSHGKLQTQHEAHASEAARNLDAMKDHIKEHVKEQLHELRSLVFDNKEKSDLAIRSELEAIREAISADLQGHGETSKEHADKLEQLLEFRGQAQDLHQAMRSELELMQGSTSSGLQRHAETAEEHKRKLEELLEFRAQMHELHQGHGETAKEHANKLQELLEFRGQSQELHQKLHAQHEAHASETTRNAEVLREMMAQQLSEVKTLFAELGTESDLALRRELETMRQATSSDLQAHGEVGKEHANKLQELLEFREQMLELQQKMQAQHEVHSGEASRNLESLRESVTNQCLETKTLVSELHIEADAAMRSELEAIREAVSADLQGHGVMTREHADKLQELLALRGEIQEMHQKLHTQQEVHSSEASRNLEALRENVNDQIVDVRKLTRELKTQILEETQNELRGHGESSKEHLLELKSHIHELHEKLQKQQEALLTHIPRNDMEHMRKNVNDQFLELRGLVQELRTSVSEGTRSELEAIRETTLADLRLQGEATNQYAKQIESEMQSQLAELRTKLAEGADQSSAALRRDLDTLREHAAHLQGHSAATKEHTTKLESELLDHLSEVRGQLVEALSHSSATRNELDDLREAITGQLQLLSGQGETTREHTTSLEANLHMQLTNLHNVAVTQGDLDAFREYATAQFSDLRGHGETAREQAIRFESQMYGQLAEINARLEQCADHSTVATRGDLSTLKEYYSQTVKEHANRVESDLQAHLSEMRSHQNDLHALREHTTGHLSDLHGHVQDLRKLSEQREALLALQKDTTEVRGDVQQLREEASSLREALQQQSDEHKNSQATQQQSMLDTQDKIAGFLLQLEEQQEEAVKSMTKDYTTLIETKWRELESQCSDHKMLGQDLQSRLYELGEQSSEHTGKRRDLEAQLQQLESQCSEHAVLHKESERRLFEIELHRKGTESAEEPEVVGKEHLQTVVSGLWANVKDESDKFKDMVSGLTNSYDEKIERLHADRVTQVDVTTLKETMDAQISKFQEALVPLQRMVSAGSGDEPEDTLVGASHACSKRIDTRFSDIGSSMLALHEKHEQRAPWFGEQEKRLTDLQSLLDKVSAEVQQSRVENTEKQALLSKLSQTREVSEVEMRTIDAAGAVAREHAEALRAEHQNLHSQLQQQFATHRDEMHNLMRASEADQASIKSDLRSLEDLATSSFSAIEETHQSKVAHTQLEEAIQALHAQFSNQAELHTERHKRLEESIQPVHSQIASHAETVQRSVHVQKLHAERQKELQEAIQGLHVKHASHVEEMNRHVQDLYAERQKQVEEAIRAWHKEYAKEQARHAENIQRGARESRAEHAENAELQRRLDRALQTWDTDHARHVEGVKHLHAEHSASVHEAIQALRSDMAARHNAVDGLCFGMERKLDIAASKHDLAASKHDFNKLYEQVSELSGAHRCISDQASSLSQDLKMELSSLMEKQHTEAHAALQREISTYMEAAMAALREDFMASQRQLSQDAAPQPPASNARAATVVERFVADRMDSSALSLEVGTTVTVISTYGAWATVRSSSGQTGDVPLMCLNLQEKATTTQPGARALNTDVEAQIVNLFGEVSKVCQEVESIRMSSTKGVQHCDELYNRLLLEQEYLKERGNVYQEKIGMLETLQAERHLENQEGLVRFSLQLSETRETISSLQARLPRDVQEKAIPRGKRSTREESNHESNVWSQMFELRETIAIDLAEVREAIATLQARVSNNDVVSELRESMAVQAAEFRESMASVQARMASSDSSGLHASLEAIQNNMYESRKQQQDSMKEMRRDLDRQLEWYAEHRSENLSAPPLQQRGTHLTVNTEIVQNIFKSEPSQLQISVTNWIEASTALSVLHQEVNSIRTHCGESMERTHQMLEMIKIELIPQISTVPGMQLDIAALKTGVLEQGAQQVDMSIKMAALRKDVNAILLPGLPGLPSMVQKVAVTPPLPLTNAQLVGCASDSNLSLKQATTHVPAGSGSSVVSAKGSLHAVAGNASGSLHSVAGNASPGHSAGHSVVTMPPVPCTTQTTARSFVPAVAIVTQQQPASFTYHSKVYSQTASGLPIYDSEQKAIYGPTGGAVLRPGSPHSTRTVEAAGGAMLRPVSPHSSRTIEPTTSPVFRNVSPHSTRTADSPKSPRIMQAGTERCSSFASMAANVAGTAPPPSAAAPPSASRRSQSGSQSRRKTLEARPPLMTATTVRLCSVPGGQPQQPQTNRVGRTSTTL